MINYVCVVVTFAIVVIAFFYFSIRYKSKSLTEYVTKTGIPLVTLSDILDTLQNGDLVFLSGTSSGEKSCKWFSGSHFSHVGIILVEYDEPKAEYVRYILECDVGQQTKDGVRIMLLQKKIQNYKGEKYGAIRRITTNPKTQDMLLFLEKYKNYDLDHDMICWMFSGCRVLHNLVKPKRKLFCSELVATCLMDLGLMKRTKLPAWYSPATFEKASIKADLLGVDYGELEYFKF